MDVQAVAQIAHRIFAGVPQDAELLVTEPVALGAAHLRLADARHAKSLKRGFVLDELLDVAQKPRIDEGHRVDLFKCGAGLEGKAHLEQACRMRTADQLEVFGLLRRVGEIVSLLGAQPAVAGFQATQGLLQRFAEGAADGHHFADGLHLVAEGVVGVGEFLEGETRDLGHHVVDGWFETRRGFAGDVVAQLIQSVADGQLGGDLRDREAGGFRGQGG